MDSELVKKYDTLMSFEWSDTERELIKSLVDTIHSYRFVTPKLLKDKIYQVLDMFIDIKRQTSL